MKPHLAIAATAVCTSLAAQDCSLPPRALPTTPPQLAQFFFGSSQPNTLNVFFDLDAQVPIRLDALRLVLFDEGGQAGGPQYQVGNRAEARIYLIPGTRTGNEHLPAAWGLLAPGSGQPDAIGSLRVEVLATASTIANFVDGTGAPTTVVLPAGHYGVAVELIPTSWAGTASIPGQQLPLLAPGPLHVLGRLPSSGTPWSDAFVTIDNDGILGSGWQTVVAGGALAPNASQGAVTGSPVLTLDYTPLVAGLAGTQAFGAGCHAAPRLVHERIPPGGGTVDLAGTQWTLAFTADVEGGHYAIVPGGPAYDSATALANGIDLLTTTPTVTSSTVPWHDGSLVYALPAARFPQGFAYPGATCTDVTISANGRIYLGAVTDFVSTFVPFGSLASMQAHAQLMPFCCNLSPSFPGQFQLEDPSPGGGIRVTWFGVQSSIGLSDVQIELLPNGTVHFAYGARLTNDGQDNVAFVGFSAGGDEPASAPIDWSAITSLVTGSGTVVPSLSLTPAPVLGTTVDTVIADLGASTLQPLGGFVAVSLGGLPAGVPLQAIGLPGCEADVDIGQLLFLQLLANTGSGDMRWTWTVPPSGNGVQVFLQGVTLTPNVHNGLGWLMTNALCVHLGL